VARYAGLTGSPDESGLKRREKGLAKAGNARVRRGMIQLAWRFLMFQKDSALAQWYRTRTEGPSGARTTTMMNTLMMQTEDKQISLTDPDARSMATSGRGSGMVGYNVQSAVDTKHHLIVTHEVTNVGSDRSQLSRMSEQARAAIGSEAIEAVADRGYYSGEEIVACEQAGVTVYLPKPITSGLNVKGRFGKQDFVYVAADDVYLCPAGEQLVYHYTNEEDGKTLRRYWTNACQGCALKGQCTTGKERRISRWEHEAVLEAVQARLDRNPDKMRERRQTVEHPFGTIKSWMGATHFQMKTLKHVGTEMALHVLAYNMKRVMRILGVGGLIEAIRA
jgi:hypothetical protein